MPTFSPEIQRLLDAHPDAIAFVTCQGEPSCGEVAVTEQQYDSQMIDLSVGWLCPTCGAQADFNEDLSEALDIRDGYLEEEEDPDAFDELDDEPPNGRVECFDCKKPPADCICDEDDELDDYLDDEGFF